MRNQMPMQKRGKPIVLLVTTIIALLLASTPVSVPAFAEWQHNKQINSLEYKQEFGFWENVDLPEEFMINSIHAATLPTGKILLVAGSGNNRKDFNNFNDNGNIKVLKTAILDPSTSEVKLIETPTDLFCSGHTLLQSGKLLVAGGTSGYELLEADVKKPAGPMKIYNENPDSAPISFKKGTEFESPSGKIYVSAEDVTLQPAHKIDRGAGDVTIHRAEVKVFVEAKAADASYVTAVNEQYKIKGLEGAQVNDVYGQGGPMTLKKQDFRGDDKAYEFDPFQEKYIKVGDLNESRWYASLPILTNGDVLAVSGLDNTGVITTTTERYDPVKKTWSFGPERPLPTYPALFRTMNPDVLFYSGSSAGYGPADVGREPGYWNVLDNTFKPVEGLREKAILETSASVALPPKKGSNDGSQNHNIMLAGGGGVGESELITSRTDVIDLSKPNARYKPGPDLPDALRYLNLTVTPWDEIFANGGTRDYRAKGNSYSFKSFSIDPASNTIKRLADEPVGRTYHSGSLLLRDGRILVFGGDPLYNDKDNTAPGKFEKRIEIYTPPQFFRGERPTLNGPDSRIAKRGEKIFYGSDNASKIKTARLIPPSSTTHVTNIEQRSVGVIVNEDKGKVSLQLPTDENLLPNGFYMLFVVDANGLPSYAKMVEITK